MSDRDFVLQQVREHKVKFVRLWFTDILGLLKSVTVTDAELPTILEHGQVFDGGSIEGFARSDESDMIARPDPATFRVLPWTAKEGATVAVMFCDILEPGGRPYEGDPRRILRRAIDEARKLGYTYYVGPEFEFFLFKAPLEEGQEPRPLDRGGYFEMTPNDLASDLRKEIAMALEALGIEVESLHHEGAPSQHEMDLRHADALTTADNAMTLRFVVKELALRRGVHATFMPKPLSGENGSGMHVHQSLFKGEKNAFYDGRDGARMSPLAKRYVAGLLAHSAEMTLVMCQWVNSYKRLVPGYEAPVHVSWATRNRSDLVRVPSVRPGREDGARVEHRGPDPACNPYLAFACLLRAGLAGIRGKYVLPPPLERNVADMTAEERRKAGIERLPEDLHEAIRRAEGSALLRETLGAHAFEKLLENKRLEWDEYRTRVTRWEIDRYLGRL